VRPLRAGVRRARPYVAPRLTIGHRLSLAILAAAALAPQAANARQLPALAGRCGEPAASARLVAFRASDGTLLDGAVLGRGPTGVVLAHESPADLCGWLPYASRLARDGFRVLVFDFRGFGLSRNPRAIAAQGRRPPVAGVVSLSGETDLTPPLGSESGMNALAAAQGLRVPLLVVGSLHDPYLPPADARRLVRAAGSRTKRLVLLPGPWHGWDLLYDAPYRSRVDALVRAFLHR
jgi:pimeloyl-ACP methyl ester carboxylesterase